LEVFANVRILDQLLNNNGAEYLKCSKIIFECFASFSQKSEQIGKVKINQWAQIQTVDGRNTITNLLVWTGFLNVSFLIFFLRLIGMTL